MKTRPFEMRDAAGLQAMVRALANHHGDVSDVDAQTLIETCHGPDAWFVTLVAERAGALLGYASLLRVGQLQFGARGVELHHLYVNQEARGIGVGHALVEALETEARAMGARYVSVGTDESNSSAHRFYQRQGYVQRPDRGPRYSKRLAIEEGA